MSKPSRSHTANSLTPLEKTEAFYDELLRWYNDGTDKELRAASKLLMVALDKFHQHGKPDWQSIIYEYLHILVNDPERFHQILDSHRGNQKLSLENENTH